MPDDYYYTDAINDEACRMIESACDNDGGEPFFLYIAHVAPHWPLHAPKGMLECYNSLPSDLQSFHQHNIILSRPEQIEKYKGSYMKGWDELRKERHKRLIDQNIIPQHWQCSPRDEHSTPWDSVPCKDWEDSRMATYAAQVTIMDQGIGRILETLHRRGCYDNTVIFFLSDNGGCGKSHRIFSLFHMICALIPTDIRHCSRVS